MTNNNSVNLYLLLSLIFIFLTNNYFNYNETLIHGGADGFDYFNIAQNYPNFAEGSTGHHRVWRFLFPYLIGFLNYNLDIDIFILFQFFTFLMLLILIFLFKYILEHFNLPKFYIFFLLCFVIYSPYFLRYYIAIPTMINDVIFINSLLLVTLGYLKSNKILLFFGFIISAFTRQNSIVLLITVIFLKLIFKKKSFLNFKNIFFLFLIIITIFFINNYFADNSTVYNDSYSFKNRFALFFGSFSLIDFIKFNLFPMVILLPIIFFIIFEKQKFYFKNSEIFIFTLITSTLIFLIAYLNGPIFTGKNIIRLINLVYPLIIISLIIHIKFKINNLIKFKTFFYLIFFIFWSFHPTFSNIKIFEFLKFLY